MIVRRVEDEATIAVVVQMRRGRQRIAPGIDPGADEQVECAVAVVVRQRERSHARGVAADQWGHSAGPWGVRNDPRHRAGVRGPGHFVGRDTGQGQRASMTVRPPEDRREIAGRRRRVYRRRLQARAGVMEKRDPTRTSRTDDQIFPPVSLEIDPCDTGTELAERVGQQGLALIVVEIRLDVSVTAELGGDVFEERRGGVRDL